VRALARQKVANHKMTNSRRRRRSRRTLHQLLLLLLAAGTDAAITRAWRERAVASRRRRRRRRRRVIATAILLYATNPYGCVHLQTHADVPSDHTYTTTSSRQNSTYQWRLQPQTTHLSV